MRYGSGVRIGGDGCLVHQPPVCLLRWFASFLVALFSRSPLLARLSPEPGEYGVHTKAQRYRFFCALGRYHIFVNPEPLVSAASPQCFGNVMKPTSPDDVAKSTAWSVVALTLIWSGAENVHIGSRVLG